MKLRLALILVVVTTGLAHSSSAFATNYPQVIQDSIAVAEQYWGATPQGCPNGVQWETTGPFDNSRGDNTVGQAYTREGGGDGCSIYVNASLIQQQNPPCRNDCYVLVGAGPDLYKPMPDAAASYTCLVVIHEVGHLLGYQHSTDLSSIMYPTIDFSYTSIPHPCVRIDSPPAPLVVHKYRARHHHHRKRR